MGADDAMRALLDAQRELEHADVARDDAMRRRDEALRAAQKAGITYATIRTATGLAPKTISKALRRDSQSGGAD